jgi:hypothetical protein
MNQLHHRVLQVNKAYIGIFSNNNSLIFNQEYFEGAPHPIVKKGQGWKIHCLQADLYFKDVTKEFSNLENLDGCFYVLDYDRIIEPLIKAYDNTLIALGDWSTLEQKAEDKRYTLFGNLGLFFRFTLKILEVKHNILSFHACTLYNNKENQLLLALGGTGGGKSALLLNGISRGFKIFSTEITPVEITNNRIVIHRSTLRNNIRLGHLIYDFPEIMRDLGLEFHDVEDVWGTKVQVDLGRYGYKGDTIVDPEIILIIPRIEEYNKECQYSVGKKSRKLKRILLDNVTDRVRMLTLIYESVQVKPDALDNSYEKRVRLVDGFLEKANITKVVNVFASPKNCLDWV